MQFDIQRRIFYLELAAAFSISRVAARVILVLYFRQEFYPVGDARCEKYAEPAELELVAGCNARGTHILPVGFHIATYGYPRFSQSQEWPVVDGIHIQRMLCGIMRTCFQQTAVDLGAGGCGACNKECGNAYT